MIHKLLNARVLWAQLPVLSAKQTSVGTTAVHSEAQEGLPPPPVESGRGQVVDIEV